MVRCSIFLFLLLFLLSCQSIHLRTGPRYCPVPNSFYDSINVIIKRLENKPNCNYIVFTKKIGNCFGDPLVSTATIIWTDSNQYFQRYIAKQKPTRKRIIDNSQERNISVLFDYFSTNRLDTVTTLPIAGWSMDPFSYCDIAVRNGPLYYSKRFEMTPFFSTKDTLHPLYVFVKMINK